MLRDPQKLHMILLYICAIMIATVYVFDIDCNMFCDRYRKEGQVVLVNE